MTNYSKQYYITATNLFISHYQALIITSVNTTIAVVESQTDDYFYCYSSPLIIINYLYIIPIIYVQYCLVYRYAL